MKVIYLLMLLFSLDSLAVAITPLQNATLYTVKKGDQLMKISQQLYGTVRRWNEIVEMNPLVEPNKLEIGMIIVVPEVEQDNQEGIVHLVKKGEQLMKISYRYFGTHQRWQEIVDVNPGINPSSIKPGQKLIIPKKEPTRKIASDVFDIDQILAEVGLLVISEYDKFVFSKSGFGTGVHQFF